MRCLALYIDNEFITYATVGIDEQIVYGKRRIWLYFHNNNNVIDFGKSFKSFYRNSGGKDSPYFGDIFNAIIDSNNKISRLVEKVSITEIFSLSGIFQELRARIQERFGNVNTSDVPVYMAFGPDVNAYGQEIFKDKMAEAGFTVKAFASSVELLALVYLQKLERMTFRKNRDTLFLSVSNNNIYVNSYKWDGTRFIANNNSFCLKEVGYDIRKKVIAEYAIRAGRTLGLAPETKEDKEQEINRICERFAGEWLSRLEKVRNGLGRMTFPNFTFQRFPGNPLDITLNIKDIDIDVDARFSNIVSMVKKRLKNRTSIENVVFLGSFFSGRLEDTFKSLFNLKGKHCLLVEEDKYPEFIKGYEFLDEGSLLSDESEWGSRVAEAETKERQLEIEREKAQSEGFRSRREELEEKKWQAYREAMCKAVECQQKEDYAQVCSITEKLLNERPNDKIAKNLYEDAYWHVTVSNVKDSFYNEWVKKADVANRNKQWEEALRMYESALEFKPGMKYPADCVRKLQHELAVQQTTHDALVKAETFMSVALYDKALVELENALKVAPEDVKLKSKIAFIKGNKEISDCMQVMEDAEHKGDYAMAIAKCEQLLVLDKKDAAMWRDKLNELKEAKADIDRKKKENESRNLFYKEVEKIKLLIKSNDCTEARKRISQLKINYTRNEFDKDILTLQALCSNQEKLNQAFQKETTRVKTLLSSGELDSAQTLLSNLKLNSDYGGAVFSKALNVLQKELDRKKKSAVLKKATTSSKPFSYRQPVDVVGLSKENLDPAFKKDSLVLPRLIYNAAYNLCQRLLAATPRLRFQLGEDERQYLAFIYKYLFPGVNGKKRTVTVEIQLWMEYGLSVKYLKIPKELGDVTIRLALTMNEFNRNFDDPALRRLVMEKLLYAFTVINSVTPDNIKDLQELGNERFNKTEIGAVCAFKYQCHPVIAKANAAQAYAEFDGSGIKDINAETLEKLDGYNDFFHAYQKILGKTDDELLNFIQVFQRNFCPQKTPEEAMDIVDDLMQTTQDNLSKNIKSLYELWSYNKNA